MLFLGKTIQRIYYSLKASLHSRYLFEYALSLVNKHSENRSEQWLFTILFNEFAWCITIKNAE